MTADGRMMFVHYQNVLTNNQSGILMGLSSGILVHVFDDLQRINRWAVGVWSSGGIHAACL